MDVLQFIKAELKEQGTQLQAQLLPQGKGTDFRGVAQSLRSFLRLEKEYLLPELTAVAPQEPLIARMMQEIDSVFRHLDEWEHSREKDSLFALQRCFAGHAQSVEDRVLPLMRQKISTTEREELYHVLADAKQDLLPQEGALVLAI